MIDLDRLADDGCPHHEEDAAPYVRCWICNGGGFIGAPDYSHMTGAMTIGLRRHWRDAERRRVAGRVYSVAIGPVRDRPGDGVGGR